MEFQPIRQYADFREALLLAGFSLSGGGNEGTFTLCDHFASNIAWHTDNPETDPWAWRVRVVEDGGVAYGKFFFRKGGFITREWAADFYALRREGRSLADLYEEGLVRRVDKQIYDLISPGGGMAYHEIKRQVGAKGLDGALARLQGGMYLTIQGQTRRVSQKLEPYGWPVNVFCRTEDFWGPEVMEQAASLSREEAAGRIAGQLRALNPFITEKAIEKFMRA